MFDKDGGSVCANVYATLRQTDNVFGTIVTDKGIDGGDGRRAGQVICGMAMCGELAGIGQWSVQAVGRASAMDIWQMQRAA